MDYTCNFNGQSKKRLENLDEETWLEAVVGRGAEDNIQKDLITKVCESGLTELPPIFKFCFRYADLKVEER
jgi:hypothetical protein